MYINLELFLKFSNWKENAVKVLFSIGYDWKDSRSFL